MYGHAGGQWAWADAPWCPLASLRHCPLQVQEGQTLWPAQGQVEVSSNKEGKSFPEWRVASSRGGERLNTQLAASALHAVYPTHSHALSTCIRSCQLRFRSSKLDALWH